MFMRRALLSSLPAALLSSQSHAAPSTLTAADGVTIAADVGTASGRRRGTILLFHMAGSNYAEYAPITPRLNGIGFDTIAIDQRSGGTEFGRRNETAARLGRNPGFAAALPDMEAALTRARGNGPVVIWGSSYSAALVFVLAAGHPTDIAAVLAFSPGEYIARGIYRRRQHSRSRRADRLSDFRDVRDGRGGRSRRRRDTRRRAGAAQAAVSRPSRNSRQRHLASGKRFRRF